MEVYSYYLRQNYGQKISQDLAHTCLVDLISRNHFASFPHRNQSSVQDFAKNYSNKHNLIGQMLNTSYYLLQQPLIQYISTQRIVPTLWVILETFIMHQSQIFLLGIPMCLALVLQMDFVHSSNLRINSQVKSYQMINYLSILKIS